MNRAFTVVLIVFIAVTALAQTAPTASAKSAAEIDCEWQASVAKYDAPRAAILKQIEADANDGPFRPDWQTLATYKMPTWFEDAKFGVFIHWGLYSVPAFGSEWYSRDMYRQGSNEFKHHVETYGPQSKFGYKDFIPLFKADKFDPQAWARLFREAGAKYVVPVAEHHDGFAMYDSALTDWSAAKMGPKRDLYGDLARAIRAEGMYVGASTHRAEHDWFFDGGRQFDSDVNDPKYASLYGPAHPRIAKPKDDHNLIEDWTYLSPQWADDWAARTGEIIEKYHPDLLYFDWWNGHPSYRTRLTELAAAQYNAGARRGTGSVIVYKDKAFMDGTAVLNIEKGQLADIRNVHWQTDSCISWRSWAYLKDDSFKDPQLILHQLIDIVSKNGNLLLNIGPRPDGTIPDEVQTRLRQIGGWLKINGEAIYGTRAWNIYGEGPTRVKGGPFQEAAVNYTSEDFRFTQKGKTIYAIQMVWPTDGRAIIHALGSEKEAKGLKIKSVELLGSDAKLGWKQTADGLELALPSAAPGKYAYAYRITID